jgi:hypothetical protein
VDSVRDGPLVIFWPVWMYRPRPDVGDTRTSRREEGKSEYGGSEDAGIGVVRTEDGWVGGLLSSTWEVSWYVLDKFVSDPSALAIVVSSPLCPLRPTSVFTSSTWSSPSCRPTSSSLGTYPRCLPALAALSSANEDMVTRR